MASKDSDLGKDGWATVKPEEGERFVRSCMEKVGSKPSHAQALAELLVTADYRGHYSHGLNRLDMYVKDVETRTTAVDEEPKILKETKATAWVDGNNTLGPVVGKFCIDLAIQKAKDPDIGIGWVVAKGSNHFGIAGWYGLRAAEQGMIGMAFTNTSPFAVPTRAKNHIIGTNPLTVVAPADKGDSFALDMATTTVALGKIEIAGVQKKHIPNGWGCDKEGKETNIPSEVLDDGGLLPLGGTEETGGYKGYALALMVEVFCGILGGAAFGPNIRLWKTADKEANLGQCFVAINPECFAPGFPETLSRLMSTCRNLPPVDEKLPVLVPGDPERQHITYCDKLGGIPYHPNQITEMADLARRLGIAPMTVSGD